MSTNRAQKTGDPLDVALRQWTVEAPLPPRFQERVWARIARTETRAQPGIRAGLQRLVDGVLPRPQYAFAYLTAFLLLGIAGGSVLAQHKSTQLESELGHRYVQSIDPYRSQLPQP